GSGFTVAGMGKDFTTNLGLNYQRVMMLGLVIVWLGMSDILAQYQTFVSEALAMLRELIGLR
ncbi:MAG: hypothetical protein B7Z23_01435, partial [Pseudomonadales bacterium 32-61-5]